MIRGVELSREHEVLLRATLGQEQIAIDAWREWQRDYDLAVTDAKGYALLPQMYLRLRDLGVQDAALAKLRGIYRHTWCRNQVIITRMAGVLSLLRDRGIGCLLLDGSAFIARSQVGLFPLEKWDCLVPGTQFAEAVAALRQVGWPQWSDAEEGVTLAHSINFTQADGMTCTIYRSVFAESAPSWADEDCWRHGIPSMIQNVPVRALSPTDHLLRLLVDVDLGHRPLSPRWVADVGTLLTAGGAAMDWERLRLKCATLRLTLPIKRSIAVLQAMSMFRCPRELEEIAETTVTTWAERREDEGRRLDPALRRGAAGALAAHWCRYKRRVGEAGRVPGFVKYLQDMWEVPSVWLLPLIALGKWGRQMGGTR
jgi:hypothetical protein